MCPSSVFYMYAAAMHHIKIQYNIIHIKQFRFIQSIRLVRQRSKISMANFYFVVHIFLFSVRIVLMHAFAPYILFVRYMLPAARCFGTMLEWMNKQFNYLFALYECYSYIPMDFLCSQQMREKHTHTHTHIRLFHAKNKIYIWTIVYHIHVLASVAASLTLFNKYLK